MSKTTLRPATPEELYLMKSLLTSERPSSAVEIFASMLFTSWAIMLIVCSVFICAGFLVGLLTDLEREFTASGGLLGLAISILILMDTYKTFRKDNDKPFPEARQREVDAAQVEVQDCECLRYVTVRLAEKALQVTCFIEVAPGEVLAFLTLDVKDPVAIAPDEFPTRHFKVVRSPELKTTLNVGELSGEMLQPWREIIDEHQQFYHPRDAERLDVSLDTLEADLIRLKRERESAK